MSTLLVNVCSCYVYKMHKNVEYQSIAYQMVFFDEYRKGIFKHLGVQQNGSTQTDL